MQSVSIRLDGEVDPELFVPWLNELVQRDGANILRCKGIVAFKDEPRRFVFQGVHMILDGDLQREWRADEPRNSRLVFIGRKLEDIKIRESFETGVVNGRA
jgi:G3E family GTPase